MKYLIATLILCVSLIHSVQAQQEPSIVAYNEPKKESVALKYWIDNNEVRTEHDISFANGKADLLPASLPAMLTIKKYLEDKNYITLLRVEGHVSCGTGAQALSEARAKAVCNWLVEQGIDCKRLLPVGFGCNKPLMDVHNELNARITLVNAALRGHAIGGMAVDGGGQVAGDPCK